MSARRRLLACSLGLLAALGVGALAEAAFVKKQPQRTPMQKLGRGVTNVATGVLEIPRDMLFHGKAGVQQGQYPFTAYTEGALKGLLTGTFKALGRTGSGVWDILSFPVAKPANYGALYQPDTIFADGNWTPPRPSRSP